jgi:hypothetical protein
LTDLQKEILTPHSIDVLVYGWIEEKYVCLDLTGDSLLMWLGVENFTMRKTSSKMLQAKWPNIKNYIIYI